VTGPGERIVEPSYDPAHVVGEFDFATVNELFDAMRGKNPWRAVILAERQARDKRFESMRTYLPGPSQIQAPEYDPQNLDLYIHGIRHINSEAASGENHAGTKAERELVQALAADYIRSPSVFERLRFIAYEVGGDRVVNFFASNLHGLVGSARSAAYTQFESQRSAILDARFPGADISTYKSMPKSLRGRPITPEQMRAAETELADVVVSAPCPDFFQLPAGEQERIVETLGREWETLALLTHAADPSLLKLRINVNMRPLAFASVETLQTAIADNPFIRPADLCMAFMRSTGNFATHVTELQRAAIPPKLRDLSVAIGNPGEKAAELTKLSDNQMEILRLREDPEVNTEIHGLALGESVPLVPRLDAVIPHKDFERIIDKNLELAGRTFYESRPNPNPLGAKLYRWTSHNPGQQLRANFAGALRNLTMTRFSVDENLLHKIFDPKGLDISVDDVCLVVLSADLKSAGRAPRPAILPLLIYVQPPEVDMDRISFTMLKGGTSSGWVVVETLYQESITIGRRVEAANRRNTFTAGSPGSGRRR